MSAAVPRESLESVPEELETMRMFEGEYVFRSAVNLALWRELYELGSLKMYKIEG